MPGLGGRGREEGEGEGEERRASRESGRDHPGAKKQHGVPALGHWVLLGILVEQENKTAITHAELLWNSDLQVFFKRDNNNGGSMYLRPPTGPDLLLYICNIMMDVPMSACSWTIACWLYGTRIQNLKIDWNKFYDLFDLPAYFGLRVKKGDGQMQLRSTPAWVVL